MAVDSVGSVVATITWMIGSGLLSYYLANFGNYDATYGRSEPQ
jgi:membrane protein